MARFFNTAGPCKPENHYTVDPLPRLPDVRGMIEEGAYFVLHAPRQTGKTTYLYALMNQLNYEGKYTALTVNIQAAASGRDADHAMMIAASDIYRQTRFYLPETEQPEPLEKLDQEMLSREQLQGYLSRWAENNPKPIVLFIDEADSLLDDLFLALLRQLRAGFELRPKGFPHSIALVGLRDVRDYKIRIRPQQESLGTGSPFNIKTESLFMDVFTPSEVEVLLDMHTAETEQVFSRQVREEIYRLSQGQPWLTNALANQIVRKVLGNDYSQTITLAHVVQAREDLIQRRDTHLDSLIDKLREPVVKDVAEAIIGGEVLVSDRLNDSIAYVQDLGLITRKSPIKFANPIYAEIVPRVLNYGWELSFNQDLVDQVWYVSNGRLDMDALLAAFQKFYRRNSDAWLEKFDFREVGRQLMLMAFLQRIINAGGTIEREMAVGNGRCDLLVEFGPQRFVIELKLLRDQYCEEEGLEQIARYLDRLGLDHGYFILFEIDPKIPWENRIYRKEVEQDGKKVSLIGM
ncbi:AAA-like domain-containing protein [bacterium]|nr:AAA-like domain-containing protein [bacterium]MBU1614920.1 AAA-like domain-containing protein [bacterium]